MIDSLPYVAIREVKIRISHNHDDVVGRIRKRTHKRADWKAIVICSTCLWISLPYAYALSTDRDQPIHIEADWAEADDMHKTVVYRGAVVITQGSMRINGEEVTLHYDGNNTLTKAEVKGRPARFQQRPDGNAKKQHAKANRMEYFAKRDLILLLGKAHSWQGKQRVSAERIEFDTKRSRVKAHGALTGSSKTRATGQSGKSRVRIVVPTRKD